MSKQYAVGIDLGGTNLRVSLVDAEGTIAFEKSRPSEPARGADVVMDDMAGMIRGLMADNNVDISQVIGVGVATPGPLSAKKGIIYKAANLPGWVNVEIQRGVQIRTGLPTIIDNDANLAAYGEYWAGAGKDVTSMVMLTLGTGVGAGVVLDGQILHGDYENAAELGHMIIVPNGHLCSCGKRGCLEQYASATNIGRRVEEAVRAGQPSLLTDMVKKGEFIGSRQICEAAQKDDAVAIRVWDEACFYLAVAICNIQHAYNPQRVVLSGGMSKAGDFLLTRVRKHFDDIKWHLAEDFPDIEIAALGDDAGPVGAAGWAWKAHNEGTFTSV